MRKKPKGYGVSDRDAPLHPDEERPTRKDLRKLQEKRLGPGPRTKFGPKPFPRREKTRKGDKKRR